MVTPAAVTLSQILADIGDIVSNSFNWAQQAINFVLTNPIILMCTLFVFVGYGVHLVKMLMRR